jgi:cation:H+ antiporter
MTDWILLVAGVLCAGLGGELFVRGSVGIAQWLRIAPGIIGATIAAFSTSSPELSVSINAAVAGKPQIALGDALGSNVVNVALILGLALVLSGIRSSRQAVRRDFSVAVLVPILIGILLIDGVLSRVDGVLMLCAFLAWLMTAVLQARKQRSAAPEVPSGARQWISILWCCLGMPLLVGAGVLIVTGAKGIAASLGLDPFVIGATIVAVGTSAPELATTLVAKVRGHDEIGLGNILGSNIFNGLFVIALAATIRPIVVDWRETTTALAFGLAALLLVLPRRDGMIPRRRGVLLLVLYGAYVAAVVVLRPSG